jgi:hypothetical protein
MFLQWTSIFFAFAYSYAEPHHFHADPDPVLHFVVDPDPPLHSAHFSISHNRKKLFKIRNLLVFVRFSTLKCGVNYITYRSDPDPRALRTGSGKDDNPRESGSAYSCSMNKVLYVVLSLPLLHFSAGMVDVILK